MKPDIPSIDQLREMGLPAPVSYAPQTWGWWLLLGLLLIALLAWVAQRLWQWRRDRYRREALQRLEQLQASSETLEALRELPELLKRVALSMPPRLQAPWRRPVLAAPSAAPLGGAAWQAFLRQHSRQPLPDDFSRQLAQLAYAPDAVLMQLPAEQRRQLFDTCRHWVEQHHVAA